MALLDGADVAGAAGGGKIFRQEVLELVVSDPFVDPGKESVFKRKPDGWCSLSRWRRLGWR